MAILGIFGAVKEVIVPRSAVFSADDPESADRLVKAFRKFIHLMTKHGFYSRFEFPGKAVQAYRALCYLGQLSTAGHYSVLQGAGSPRHDWSEVLTALTAIGAEAHLAVATRMSAVLARYPNIQSFRDAPADEQQFLRELDKEFRAIEKTTPMRVQLARWISGWPELKVVEDSEHIAAIHRLAKKSPQYDVGQASRSVGKLNHQMLDRREVALSLACAQIPDPEGWTEMKVLAAIQWSVEIEGEPQVVTHVRTNKALRYGLLTDTHAAIYERIEVPPFREEERMLDCVKEGRHPKPANAIVGRRLSLVPSADIDEVAALAEKYRAPTALDLLLRQAGMLDDEVYVVPLRVRAESAGSVVRWAVASRSRAISFEIGPHGAFLLSNGDNRILRRATRREIEKQAKRIEALKLKLEQASLIL